MGSPWPIYRAIGSFRGPRGRHPTTTGGSLESAPPPTWKPARRTNVTALNHLPPFSPRARSGPGSSWSSPPSLVPPPATRSCWERRASPPNWMTRYGEDIRSPRQSCPSRYSSLNRFPRPSSSGNNSPSITGLPHHTVNPAGSIATAGAGPEPSDAGTRCQHQRSVDPPDDASACYGRRLSPHPPLRSGHGKQGTGGGYRVIGGRPPWRSGGRP